MADDNFPSRLDGLVSSHAATTARLRSVEDDQSGAGTTIGGEFDPQAAPADWQDDGLPVMPRGGDPDNYKPDTSTGTGQMVM
jgi:hypothetical protein